MGDAPESRPMRYPYTLGAKIAQFPFKFHMSLNWYYKYYLIGMAVSLPVFYKIHKLANSPENMIKIAEKEKKNLKEIEEHKKHLK